MRVGILIDQLVAGGVQKTAILEAKYLQKLGYKTKLLVLMRKGLDKNTLSLAKGTDVKFLSDRYPKALSKSIKFPIFHFLSTLHILSPFLTSLAVKQKEFDFIISHGTTTTFTALTLKITRKIPYIFVVHDPMQFILEKIYTNTTLKTFFIPLKTLSFLLEKLLIKNTTKVVLDSPVHLNFIKKTYKVEPQVIYLALDLKKSSADPVGDKILTFGRWDKGKKLDLLLKVVKEIPDSKLIVAGTWTNKEDLIWFKKLIRTEKLAKRVEIVEKYSEGELVDLSKESRLWVHPNFEAFSLSALEAASYGLPIIIPQKSGVTNLFQEKIHGFFPKTNSPKDLKMAIETLLNNKTLAQKMGRLAQKRASEVSSPQKRAAKLAEIIKLAKEPKIAALEISHIGKEGTAGGDLLLENLLRFSKQKLPFSIIVSGNASHWNKERNLKIIRLKAYFFEKFTNPFAISLTYFERIIRSFFILKRKKWDLIYSSTDIIADTMPAFLAKITNPKVKWIARIHHISQEPSNRPGNYFTNLVSTTMQKVSLTMIRAQADMVIVLNSRLKNQLKANGFKNKNIEIVTGGVNFEYFSKFKPNAKRHFDAVYLGRLHRTKGIFDLPIIWKEVTKNQKAAKMAVIGPGDDKSLKSLRKMFNDLHLRNKVKIFGFLENDKVASILKSSKVFLFTDHEAGFGLAVAEAMACSLPIVGYDIGILGYVFKTGYIKVPKFDTKEYAEKVSMLLKNQHLRKKLSAKAKIEAAKFDWSKTSSKFVKILYTMIR